MTAHFSIKFDLEEVPYEANVTVLYHDDQNYGADADENRGTFRRFIDDVIVRGVIDQQGTLVAPSEAMLNKINILAGENL